MTATAAPVTAKRGTLVLGVVLALISLPALVVAADAVRFRLANRSNGAFVSSGEARTYLLHVPANYDPARPSPLVISMHGAGGWPVQQMEVSGWNRLADREGFIVVYPSAVEGVGPRIWRVGRWAGLNRDVGFISALIDTLQARYNIDASMIYANGLSNGGGMTFVLSCALSNRIAAVGMVAAAQTLPWSWCTDHRPVPMIAFHGTADPDIPYDGGASWMAPNLFPNVRQWTRNWARRNQCGTNPVESEVAADVTRLAYGGCADGADVLLYTIRGGGHTWPGGGPLPEWWLGPTSRSIDASGEMWAFFRAHRRPGT
jgi:polyhydroxybutyrate depolymerase